jgi:hypothetical protein
MRWRKQDIKCTFSADTLCNGQMSPTQACCETGGGLVPMLVGTEGPLDAGGAAHDTA